MSEEIVVEYKIDDTEVKLTPTIVKNYLTGGVDISMPEFKMFTELCKARKLNPFLKEAYIIKYGNAPATIVVGKDAVLKKAIIHPKFNGREQGIIVKTDKGIEERKGTFMLEDEELVGGWARIYRKDWEYPTYISVSFNEVAQRKRDGSLNSAWATKSATMVEKVALVRGLRETFADELGGMIDEDEAWKQEDIRGTSQPIEEQPEPKEEEVIETEIDFSQVE